VKLLEVASKTSGIIAVKNWIFASVPGLGYAYTITPTRVWTRGDGYRYRDHPYIEFASKADAEKV